MKRGLNKRPSGLLPLSSGILKPLRMEEVMKKGADLCRIVSLSSSSSSPALSSHTHRLPLATRITQNPPFAWMPLERRGDSSAPGSPLSTCATLIPGKSHPFTFTPCRPWGPFTPAGQLVGHWKENPIRPEVSCWSGPAEQCFPNPLPSLTKTRQFLQTPFLTKKSALPSRPWMVPGRP